MRNGGVPERSNGSVLKTDGRASAPWVRIPLPPYEEREPSALPRLPHRFAIAVAIEHLGEERVRQQLHTAERAEREQLLVMLVER